MPSQATNLENIQYISQHIIYNILQYIAQGLEKLLSDKYQVYRLLQPTIPIILEDSYESYESSYETYESF